MSLYEDIDAILGTWGASQPPVVDCANEEGIEVRVDIEDEQEGMVFSNNTLSQSTLFM